MKWTDLILYLSAQMSQRLVLKCAVLTEIIAKVLTLGTIWCDKVKLFASILGVLSDFHVHECRHTQTDTYTQTHTHT